ncbi:MAG: bifunctional oligoribonuclease/PAP phosphatase NrnA [Bacteroidales bacterium]|nr:bifunctional oligoribonuclease/PAP phosphatase NrnA [Bacteroidales bacterium]
MLKQKITPQELDIARKKWNECKNVVIVTHTSPDGDAIGSSLALYEYLKRKGKNVTVIVPNYFPDFLHWMKDADKIIMFDRQKSLSYSILKMADLICCLDFNEISRIDDLGVAVMRTKCDRLLIDHHLHPNHQQFRHIISHPEASSTCELVFRIINSLGDMDKLTLAGAEDLYAGMATDTGFFSYNSNDPDIFLIISELLKKGIDKDLINRKIQNNYSADRLKLIGYVLYEKLQVFPDLHASLIYIKKEELSQFHYLKGDMEGIVNMPLQIKGHKLSILLREDTERPLIRVSTRSVDDLACNEFCAQFYNGGGHKNASGGTLECSMEKAVELTMKALEMWRDKLADAPVPASNEVEQETSKQEEK